MLTDNEILEVLNADYGTMPFTVTGEAFKQSRQVLEADQKARQDAMVNGIKLVDVFDEAVDDVMLVATLHLTNDEKAEIARRILAQVTDFVTTPSSGPVPAIEKLAALDEGKQYSEADHFVAEHFLQLGFEPVNDDATVYGCTLSQVLALLEARQPRNSPEYVDWEAICERGVVAICEGKKYLGLIEADVVAVGTLIESVAKLRKRNATLEQYRLNMNTTVGKLGRPMSTLYSDDCPLCNICDNQGVAVGDKCRVCGLVSPPDDKVGVYTTLPTRFQMDNLVDQLLGATRTHGTGKEVVAAMSDLNKAINFLLAASDAPLPPNIHISRHGVAVDQNYRFNYDMSACPGGKVQLLGEGGIPSYGKKTDPGVWKAWAPLPKA